MGKCEMKNIEEIKAKINEKKIAASECSNWRERYTMGDLCDEWVAALWWVLDEPDGEEK